jgi:hypothetical protein
MVRPPPHALSHSRMFEYATIETGIGYITTAKRRGCRRRCIFNPDLAVQTQQSPLAKEVALKETG